MSLESYQTSIHALAERRMAIERVVERVETQLDRLEQEIGQWRTLVTQIAHGKWGDQQSRLQSVIAAWQDGAHRLALLQTAVDSHINAVRHAPGTLTGLLQQEEDELRQFADDLVFAQTGLTEAMNDTIETGAAEVRELVGARVEEVTDRVDTVRDECVQRADEVLEWVETMRSTAADVTEELFTEGLPGMIRQKTEALDDSLSVLKDSGVGQLSHLKDAVDGVTQKVHTVTGLVNAVKPPLDVARQIL
jgi:ABC-type transporter Mla subunit MlaD